jgi:acetyltransferase-like isoleucine patch superfamily enzyme
MPMIKDRLASVYVRFFRRVYARRFGSFGRNVYVVFPAGIEGAERISLGNDVYIASGTYLAATPRTKASSCQLKIGDGTKLGRFNHIYATRMISIGRNVLTANGVYIADNTHGFENPHEPILRQEVKQLDDVTIGDGAWLGHNVCVLGASIGAQSVIGANSVVTRNIPDHCVVVGAPARIVRRYDHTQKYWRKTYPDGTFREEASTG